MNNYYYQEQDTFAELSEQVAELNRELDRMTRGSSGVHATQSPFINYDSFGGHHSFYRGTSNFESEQYVGNFNSQYHYPNSDFYNLGWPNQSNFEWQQEQVPQWGAEEYLPSYQEQIQSHHQPQEEEKPLFEDWLMQHITDMETHLQNQQAFLKSLTPSFEDTLIQHITDMETRLQDQQAFLESLTVQKRQVVSAISNESQESLLSDTENNLVQENEYDCDDVEIMVEDEVKDVVENLVKIEDSEKPTQSTEMTIMLISARKEFGVNDSAEHMNVIDTKPRPQLENNKKSKFKPYEQEKCRKKKGTNWIDRKVLDDHLRLCRRGCLFKAQKRLRRNTFNTRWR